MRSKRLRIKIIVVLVLFAFPLESWADILGCPGSNWPWAGQGPFVNIPAAIGASPSGPVGAALALAFAPADLIEAGISGRQQDVPIPRFAHIGVCGGVYLGKGLAFIVGSPFWLLKQAFWDGPKRLFAHAPPEEAPPQKPVAVP